MCIRDRVVDSPEGIQFGSSTAAPIAKEFMENALPYLGINPTYTLSLIHILHIWRLPTAEPRLQRWEYKIERN